MEPYRLAKITATLLTLAIVGFYRGKFFVALCGSIASASLILSLLFSSRLPEKADLALSICSVSFGLLTFVLWARLSIQEQRKAESHQDH